MKVKINGKWKQVPTSNIHQRVPKEENQYSEIPTPDLLAAEKAKTKEIVLWEGLAKVGEPDFMVWKERGDRPSVCLVPIPYKTIKHKRGKLIWREEIWT